MGLVDIQTGEIGPAYLTAQVIGDEGALSRLSFDKALYLEDSESLS